MGAEAGADLDLLVGSSGDRVRASRTDCRTRSTDPALAAFEVIPGAAHPGADATIVSGAQAPPGQVAIDAALTVPEVPPHRSGRHARVV